MGLLTILSFATVNLSDLFLSIFIFLTNSLEVMSLSKILVACLGCVVRVFAAVATFNWEFYFSNLRLGGLPLFLLICVLSTDFVLCR